MHRAIPKTLIAAGLAFNCWITLDLCNDLDCWVDSSRWCGFDGTVAVYFTGFNLDRLLLADANHQLLWN